MRGFLNACVCILSCNTGGLFERDTGTSRIIDAQPRFVYDRVSGLKMMTQYVFLHYTFTLGVSTC